MLFDISLNNTLGVANKLIFSGAINISREVHGPLELLIEINRCDLDMKNCEKMTTQRFSGMCQKLRDKRAFYYNALTSITPPLECPFEPQNYIATNSTVDLMALAFMPLSDSAWLTIAKLFSGEGKRREIVMCTELEMRVNRIKSLKSRRKH